MITLYTEEIFNNSKGIDTLPLKCYNCYNIFHKQKKRIKSDLKLKKNSCKFCSHKCANDFRKKTLNILIPCKNCDNKIVKKSYELKKHKNQFCSKSCAATYNNKNKSTGNRRSKLESWIEEQLILIYPQIEFHFNRKDTINSELDIYIPSFELAFELNGIFHYEPIYGSNKLNQIQNNDISKSKACIDNQIDLCIIDTSSLKYFKPIHAQKYLDIIVNIINQRTSC